MTRRTNARIAGVTYLAYIAVALPATILFDKAANGQGTAAKLAGIAQHASDVRVAAILGLLSCFAALVLAVTLYAITRDEDRDLALLALSCRLGEGVLNALHLVATLCLLWLATERGAGDSAGADALGGFLLKGRSFSETISANFFAVGSTLFSWLLLRGRIVPAPLTWLGVASSVLIAVALPVELAGFLRGPVVLLMWFPMLVFELALALWLLVKGAAMPRAEMPAGLVR